MVSLGESPQAKRCKRDGIAQHEHDGTLGRWAWMPRETIPVCISLSSLFESKELPFDNYLPNGRYLVFHRDHHS